MGVYFAIVSPVDDRSYANRLETLMQASVDLNRLLPDTDRVFENAIELLSRSVYFTSASVQTLYEDHLEIVAYKGFTHPDIVQNLRFPLDSSYPNYRVVRDRISYSVPDTHLEYPHFRDEAEKFDSAQIRSWLGVPLLAGGTVIELVTLDRTEVCPFSDADIRLVEAFAGHIAIARRNGLLYAQLEEANRVRETLFRELNHRVQNNMQIISSLIDLKVQRVSEEETVEALQDMRNRVSSLAMLHLQLNETDWTGQSEILPYLKSIVDEVRGALLPPDSGISITVSGGVVTGDSRTLTNLGLVVTELVTNGLKYAFPDRQRGEIRVRTGRPDGRHGWFVEVDDDGVGIGEDTISASDSLGILIVKTLSEQIGATIEVGPSGTGTTGTRWRLEKVDSEL